MIIKDRLKECIDILTHILRQTGEETIMMQDGREYNRIEVVNMVSKWLYKALIDDMQKTEDYLQFLIESIHYVMGLDNEPPKINVVTVDELQKIHNFYHDENPKFVVKTK